MSMKLTSPAFDNDSLIPSQYTCNGENTNPTLEISHVPVNAKSLTLIVDDPDSLGDTWVHWILWNIVPTTTQIAHDHLPSGASIGMNDFGITDYGGPCPANGKHHYFFKLYALDCTFDLAEGASKDDVEKVMEEHIIEKVELIGLYEQN